MLGSAVHLTEVSDTETLTTQMVTEIILLEGLSSLGPLFESLGMVQVYLEEIFAIFWASALQGTLLPQVYQHGCSTEIHIA